MRFSRRPARPRLAPLLAGAAGGVLAAGAGATLFTAGLARIPLTTGRPEHQRLRVRAIESDAVVLDAAPDTLRPGLLALRQGGGSAHVRLGEVIDQPTPGTVRRRILARDTAEPLLPGRAAMNGFFWAGDPLHAHGMEFCTISVESPVGSMPSWLIPGSAEHGSTWVIIIHGHGATRGEALRVLPLLHALGLSVLVISYRNDVGAAPSSDAKHHLGSAEWEDADAAIATARARGAERVILMGYSMGGGIALRTSIRGAHRALIDSIILVSPAIDWRDILTYQAQRRHVPAAFTRAAASLMSTVSGSRILALTEPIQLAELSSDYIETELRTPTLLITTADDETVPWGPSAALAAARPDLVTAHLWRGASHTREWNFDPARFEAQVRSFVQSRVPTARVGDDRLPVRSPAAPPQALSSGARL